MPRKPPRLNPRPPAPIVQRRRQVDRDRYRRSTELRRWYMRKEWHAGVRLQELRREPLCLIHRDVFGMVVEADEVHHCRPGPYADFSDFLAGPFASLCGECHKEVEASKRHGRRPFDGACGLDGWPIAPLHDPLWQSLGARTP